LKESRAFLRRWADVFTREACDDLAQEAAFAALQRQAQQRDPGSFTALVRTISRRMRARALKRGEQRPVACVADGDLADWPEPAVAEPDALLVAGRPVPRPWLLAQLDAALPQLTAANRLLLLGYYEGFSCSELGERFGISVAAVKVRLHRSRSV